MPSRFLQIHTLTSYPGSLLNRDDAGFAKRLPFGGAVRTRVSSQCLKRHWRTFDGEGALGELDLPATYRSRQTFERFVVAPLLDAGRDEAAVRKATEEVVALVLGKSDKAKADEESGKGKKEKKDAAPARVETNQVTVLGAPEVSYLRSVVEQIVDGSLPSDGKALKKLLGDNLIALKTAAGLNGALFGRMATSDILARGDAAVHVAHAFTVHAEESEPDYFSAVDDFPDAEQAQGAGHIGTTELTSGLFYGYVVVDLPLLVSNLTGCPRDQWTEVDRDVAGRVVAQLLPIIATVSPGAKLGSTAPYAYAQAMLVEAGNAQPRTLANAFLRPVAGGRDGLLAAAYRELSAHVSELDGMYAVRTDRRVIGLGLDDVTVGALGASRAANLPDLAAWAASRVTA